MGSAATGITTGVLVGVGVVVGTTGVLVASGGALVGEGCVGVAVEVGGENDGRGTVVALPDSDSAVAVGVETGGIVDDGVLDGVGATGDCGAGTSVGVTVEAGSLFGSFDP